MSQNQSNAVPAVGQLRPRSQFDVAFVRHVLPRLVGAIQLGGHMVRHGLEDYGDASSRVRDHGVRLGLSRLTPAFLAELLDWIAVQLVEAIDAPDPPGLITPERLAKITGEPRRTPPGGRS